MSLRNFHESSVSSNYNPGKLLLFPLSSFFPSFLLSWLLRLVYPQTRKAANRGGSIRHILHTFRPEERLGAFRLGLPEPLPSSPVRAPKDGESHGDSECGEAGLKRLLSSISLHPAASDDDDDDEVEVDSEAASQRGAGTSQRGPPGETVPSEGVASRAAGGGRLRTAGRKGFVGQYSLLSTYRKARGLGQEEGEKVGERSPVAAETFPIPARRIIGGEDEGSTGASDGGLSSRQPAGHKVRTTGEVGDDGGGDERSRSEDGGGEGDLARSDGEQKVRASSANSDTGAALMRRRRGLGEQAYLSKTDQESGVRNGAGTRRTQPLKAVLGRSRWIYRDRRAPALEPDELKLEVRCKPSSFI